jgi:hypothetical protein
MYSILKPAAYLIVIVSDCMRKLKVEIQFLKWAGIIFS